MDLNALRYANFARLDAAVEDWAQLVRNLRQLQKDAEKGLHQAANDANWAGLNAQVSKEFIGKTAGEFSDAHTQAKSIHNILRDTSDELKGYHKQLNDAIERGLKKNLTVTPTGGGGFTVTMNVHPDRAAQGHPPPKHDAQEVTALLNEVQEILRRATDSDNSAKTVLTSLADQSRTGFSDAKYKDRDAAANAIRKADELAALLRKKLEDLTPTEFDRLNAGLKKYGNDPLFAERFATGLGPKKVLEFWNGINTPNHPGNNPELYRTRLDQLDDLQRNLGMTLAKATQSDSGAMAQWKHSMIDLGDKNLSRGGPSGFQVMSNLMRTGDYDDQFLKDYGNKLMATERELTHNGEQRNAKWQFMGSKNRLNHLGGDSGTDPLSGYMKGLANSPDAATSFFNQPYTQKDGDRPALDNFEYLFEKREWPQETDSHGHRVWTGRDNLAQALEAATTGHPAGELPTKDTPTHSSEQAKLTQELIHSISEDPERLKKNLYMGDSIGQIGAEYLPDIHRAMSNPAKLEAGELDTLALLYPHAGAVAQLNDTDVTRFLVTTSQSPQGYAALSVGEQQHLAHMMSLHLNPELPDSQRYPHDAEDTITRLARGSGQLNGLLAQGRQEAILGPLQQKDDDYNYQVSQKKNLISGVVATGVGVGTSFIGTPALGAAAGGVAGGVTSLALEEIFHDDKGQYAVKSGLAAGEGWEKVRDTTGNASHHIAYTTARNYDARYLEQVRAWVSAGTQSGFNDARTAIDGMAKDLDHRIG